MIRNYFKIAWRNLRKNKVFSFINIFGLAIGMVACIIILQYVSFETSYDDFRKPTLYRIADYSYINGTENSKRAQTAPALAPVIKREIPEVIDAARVVHTAPLMSDPVMQSGEYSFHEEKIYFADPSFLSVFSYQMTSGTIEQSLNEPNTVVISESMKQKYFSGKEALDKSLIFHEGERGSVVLNVTGVFKDIPENSHLHTDFLVSFSSLPWNLDENWDWGNFYNYVEILPGTDPSIVKNKINAVQEKYRGEIFAEWRKGGYTRELYLQPIQDIHLDSHLEAEAESNGSRRIVEILSVVALFVLAIAWINYINLTTAKSVERAKEIGVRKISGSNRKQLSAQFLTESFLTNSIATLLAFIIIRFLEPSLHKLTNINFNPELNTEITITLIALFLAGVVLSGLYPTFVLSSFNPLQVLKKNLNGSGNGNQLRKGLVVFQFAASIILIVVTLTFKKQLNFMLNKNLGINLEKALIVKGPGIKDSTYQDHLSYFKHEVTQIPSVKEVAVSSSIPGRELSWGRSFYQPDSPENRHGVNIVAVDEDFFDLYETSFVAGRNFSKENTSDRGALIFNETAIHLLGFQKAGDAIQKNIIWEESENDLHSKEIIGVIKDFNQESLQKEVGPIVFALKQYLNAPWAGEYYSLKVNTEDYPKAMAQIKEKWNQAFPNSPFEYFFLDEFYNRQYQAESQFNLLFSVFSALAIFIASMGLFGLSYFTTTQKIKEIGIRKVNGARVSEILTMLNNNFLKWMAIAFVVSVPPAYYTMHKWLESFAYRTNLSWWIFALAGILALGIALLTVSWQSWRAATRNPVEALRYE
ncbi:FtsX-like permease family protein [Maribellus comscasis]|uniref:FtsX-like permease family protein n=1 Tax=Maribellus comscasis TaxID=2681766 RepID=A0A6I6K3Z2_9BACT|nr:ABC transporter permease [Maribellus comscasis]QGY44664.1 FtsX-like permease family protein [Maribellus comscasis]